MKPSVAEPPVVRVTLLPPKTDHADDRSQSCHPLQSESRADPPQKTHADLSATSSPATSNSDKPPPPPHHAKTTASNPAADECSPPPTPPPCPHPAYSSKPDAISRPDKTSAPNRTRFFQAKKSKHQSPHPRA